MSFSELGLSDPILRAIQTEGYTAPTPIQAQSIPHVLQGRDLLGSAQTGTGKTAAFALPILHRLIAGGNPPTGSGRKIRVLVLAPTRELAVQIGENFSAYGRNTALRNAVIFGGVGQGAQVEALRRGIDILVATPGRLNDLIGQGYIDLRHLKIFVLDEADRMLDVGFLPDIRRVITHLPAQRQTLFFSATMPAEVRRLADDLLTDPARVEIAPVKSTAELIEQSVCHVQKGSKTRLLAGFIKQPGVRRSIVFSRTKHGADKIVRQLFLFGIRGEAIHGNKSQNARQRTLDRFRTGKLRVLVATDLAARGIDVDDITHVFNFDLPHEPETYVHRIGRTGRAGANGQAIAFCDPSERGLLKSIERLMRKTIPVCTELPVPAAPSDEERESLEKILADEQAERDEAEATKPRRGPGARRRRPGPATVGEDRPPREGGERPRRPGSRPGGRPGSRPGGRPGRGPAGEGRSGGYRTGGPARGERGDGGPPRSAEGGEAPRFVPREPREYSEPRAPREGGAPPAEGAGGWGGQPRGKPTGRPQGRPFGRPPGKPGGQSGYGGRPRRPGGGPTGAGPGGHTGGGHSGGGGAGGAGGGGGERRGGGGPKGPGRRPRGRGRD